MNNDSGARLRPGWREGLPKRLEDEGQHGTTDAMLSRQGLVSPCPGLSRGYAPRSPRPGRGTYSNTSGPSRASVYALLENCTDVIALSIDQPAPYAWLAATHSA
jgi:hypothetical protein